MLRRHDGIIDRPPIDTRRCTGLQAADSQQQFAQPGGQPVRRRIACPTSCVLVEPDVDASAEERPDGEHHRSGGELDPGDGDDASDPPAFEAQVGDLLLKEREVRLVFELLPDRLAVQHPVGLGTGGADRRALAGIEGAELDAGPIHCPGHTTPEGIDFTDQVSFADAAKGGIATHLAQRFDALCQQ